jgi:hypothetical protein
MVHDKANAEAMNRRTGAILSEAALVKEQSRQHKSCVSGFRAAQSRAAQG